MGKSKKQTVGYKYFVGLHMIVSQWPVDHLKALRIGEKMAWRGEAQSGQIQVNKPELFGGKGRGGGWKGPIDVMRGAMTQLVNTYLSDKIGTPISAFRGVFSLAFRQNYIGDSPFLNRIAIHAQWVYTAFGGWLPGLAAVPALGDDRTEAETGFVYIAIDASSSMFPTRMNTLKDGVTSMLESLKGAAPSIRIVTFGEAATALDAIEYLDASDADLDAAKTWVNAIAAPAEFVGANYLGGVASAPTFFAKDGSQPAEVETSVHSILGDIVANLLTDGEAQPEVYSRRILIFLSDGLALTSTPQAARDLIDTIPGVVPFVINIGLEDTTNTDIVQGSSAVGVPVAGPFEILVSPFDTSGVIISPKSDDVPAGVLNQWVAVPEAAALDNRIDEITATPFGDFSTGSGGGLGGELIHIYFWIDASQFPNGTTFKYTDVLVGGSNSEVLIQTHPNFFAAYELTQAQFEGAAGQDTIFLTSTGYPIKEGTGTKIPREFTFTKPNDAEYIRVDLKIKTSTRILDDYWNHGIADALLTIEGQEETPLDLALDFAFFDFYDRNPAHILRDLIVAPWYGGDGDESLIGDSYATGAQTLYDEHFGLSIFHEAPSQKADFQKLIEEHIDAKAYFDRTTGKWELKLIRDDYDVNDLFTFDQSNITDWVSAERPRQHELPNQITVKFSRRDNGESNSVTVHNIAAIQQVGTIIPETRDYPGITVDQLAGVVALRDLTARTVPSWRGSFRATYVPADLHPGFAFIINDDRIGMENVVCRITEIDFGDGRSNEVVISFVEDRFSIGDQSLVSTDPGGITGGLVTALAPTIRLVEEAPYYLTATTIGEVETDTRLADEPDLGVLMATTNKPNGAHINGYIAKYNGTNWFTDGTYDFAPVATLAADVDGAGDTVTITTDVPNSLYTVAVNDLAYIDNEIVRVDDITVTGGVATITVGRGCLDTVPAPHTAGASVVFWYRAVGSDLVNYVSGETLDVRLLPRTFNETLLPAATVTESVTFASRMIRPYPAGQVKAAGQYIQGGEFPGPVALTWAHRDRLTQTTATPADFDDGDIGPEASTTYTVRLDFYGATGVLLGTVDRSTGITGTTYTLTDIATGQPAGATDLSVSVVSVRGGYEAWQSYQIWYALADADLETEAGEIVMTEDGATVELENA